MEWIVENKITHFSVTLRVQGVRMIQRLKGCRIEIKITHTVKYSDIVAVIVTVYTHKNSVRFSFVCGVDDIQYLLAIFYTIWTFKRLVADNDARAFSSFQRFLQPFELIRGDMVTTFAKVIGEGEVNVLTILQVIVGIHNNESVAAIVKLVIAIGHIVML